MRNCHVLTVDKDNIIIVFVSVGGKQRLCISKFELLQINVLKLLLYDFPLKTLPLSM